MNDAGCHVYFCQPVTPARLLGERFSNFISLSGPGDKARHVHMELAVGGAKSYNSIISLAPQAAHCLPPHSPPPRRTPLLCEPYSPDHGQHERVAGIRGQLRSGNADAPRNALQRRQVTQWPVVYHQFLRTSASNHGYRELRQRNRQGDDGNSPPAAALLVPAPAAAPAQCGSGRGACTRRVCPCARLQDACNTMGLGARSSDPWGVNFAHQGM